MARTVKRRYDVSERRRRAAATGERILDSALALFSERGYARTTVASVAHAAGVDPDTVFERFGSKPKLLEAVLLRGERAGGAPPDDGVEANTADELIAAAVRGHLVIAKRLARVVAAMREGAAGRPELRALFRAGEARRLASAARWVAALDRMGALRRDLSRDHAAEVLWLVRSPETYHRLVVERRWSQERYRAWLGGTLRAVLVDKTLTRPRRAPRATRPRPA